MKIIDKLILNLIGTEESDLICLHNKKVKAIAPDIEVETIDTITIETQQ